MNIYLIKININLNTLENREKVRESSPVGHARSHYDTVYGSFQYDTKDRYEALEIAFSLKELVRTF